MPFTLASNKNVPQVQEPVADLGSLLTTVKSLKQGVESLGGYRGTPPSRAVTFDDLAGLGLVTPVTGSTSAGMVTSGVASSAELAEEVTARKDGDAKVGDNFRFTEVVGVAGATIPISIIAGAHEMVVMITGTGAITVTTPTADEIIAAVPFWEVGGIYRFRLCNPTPGTINIAPGMGVTITGLPNTTTNKWREWLVRYMAPSSVDFRDIGSGDA